MAKILNNVGIVSENDLCTILQNRTRGQFLCLTKDAKICAVDNSTGDAWTENFDNLEAAIYWLQNRTVTVGEAHAVSQAM